MIAAGYLTDMYCDCDDCSASPDYAEFVGQSKAETYRKARKLGWRISRDQERAFAPSHKVTRKTMERR